MIAMLVIGCVLFPAVGPWEFKFAKYPVVPRRFITNFTVVGASLIGFFDYACPSSCSRLSAHSPCQISFYLTYVYLYSFVIVVKPWSVYVSSECTNLINSLQVSYQCYLLHSNTIRRSDVLRYPVRSRHEVPTSVQGMQVHVSCSQF